MNLPDISAFSFTSASPSDAALPLFARRLKAVRLQQGLSQEKLGIEAGVDEFSASARINQYERGKHTPDVLTAANLARVLKVPLSYFYATDDDEALLLVWFHRCSEMSRKQILAVVQEVFKTETQS